MARGFGGELDAHALARCAGFPDSVTYDGRGHHAPRRSFTYGAGRVLALLDTTASPCARCAAALGARPGLGLGVGGLGHAGAPEPGTPWREPGGTPGRLLAETTWRPGDTVPADTVVCSVDSLAVARIADRRFPGVLVTTATPGAACSSRRLRVSHHVPPRPARHRSRADGCRRSAGVRLHPRPAATGAAYRRGRGSTARTVLRLRPRADGARLRGLRHATRLPARAAPRGDPQPGRAPAAASAGARTGFRPLGPRDSALRRVWSRSWAAGRRSAPPSPSGDWIPARASGAGRRRGAGRPDRPSPPPWRPTAPRPPRTVTWRARGPRTGAQFGYLWFDRRPRLRLVYTLPLRPRLP